MVFELISLDSCVILHYGSSFQRQVGLGYKDLATIAQAWHRHTTHAGLVMMKLLVQNGGKMSGIPTIFAQGMTNSVCYRISNNALFWLPGHTQSMIVCNILISASGISGFKLHWGSIVIDRPYLYQSSTKSRPRVQTTEFYQSNSVVQTSSRRSQTLGQID